MKKYNFHFEIHDILNQFCAAFNDIVIKRYNAERLSQEQLEVSFVYAPKQRVLHDIVNKNQHVSLPVIAITMGSISRNENRVFNKIDGASFLSSTKSKNPSAYINLLQPVPVSINVQMNIIAKFQEDIDQIITNFAAWNNPYIVISSKWPAIPEIFDSEFEIRTVVHWDGNISFQYPFDIAATQSQKYMASTSFIIESYIFKPELDPGALIWYINHTFNAVSAIDEYETMKSWDSILTANQMVEYAETSGRPQFRNMEPYIVYTGNPQTFNIWGSMFDKMDSMWLSATNWNMLDTSVVTGLSGVSTVNAWTSSIYYSSVYLPFEGIEIPKEYWNHPSDNLIELTLSFASSGIFDIIGMNGGGWGSVMVDSIRPTLNPYPSGSQEWLDYVEFQYPVALSGIQVKSL